MLEFFLIYKLQSDKTFFQILLVSSRRGVKKKYGGRIRQISFKNIENKIKNRNKRGTTTITFGENSITNVIMTVSENNFQRLKTLFHRI